MPYFFTLLSLLSQQRADAQLPLLLSPEQLIIYQVGVLPSHFYSVLADKDYPGFQSLVGTAMVLILLNSTVGPRSRERPLTYPLIAAAQMYQKRSTILVGHPFTYAVHRVWSADLGKVTLT